eukprot:NODE_3219_length_1008_cov_92.284904_g3073_i0.p1 GENE.NODE_3219_length_1008_cov_92.284904_g3073_i0~~NODE_3219_length_1008_cov_92.284904_g3073_i0.p1  ORF type:complete len:325 (-),score=64.44 NODE_3219_length_1008_cov_92.284904_g3073_i0:32-967(-)
MPATLLLLLTLCTSTNSRNLVLGMCVGYPNNFTQAYAPFLHSALAHLSTETFVVLFVNEAIYDPFRSWVKCLLPKYRDPPNVEVHPAGLATLKVKWRNLPLATERYVVYWSYLLLNNRTDLYANTMLTDTRDVLFQGDPFPIITEPKVYMFAEDKRIGGSLMNRNWMRGCYVGEKSGRLLHVKIICSGVTMGMSAPVSAYLRAMIGEMMWLRTKLHCKGTGIDQPAHNAIAYRPSVPFSRVLLMNNDPDNPVYNMALNSRHAHRNISLYKWQGDKLVRGERPPAVLHQYDRHRQLAQYLRSLYHTEMCLTE